ncbi:DUF427 domain-containing protein [Microvirga antarctica]|uniref:DUF427 domain-containing protein n=1 Tax=Microvirga antarctica TaxID=2819233 RepID=UPI001B3104FC|nr:DUF427 domain-containing protein [Microvirga antarctica]
MTPLPDPIRPGQESVWDYPRPAVAEDCDRHITIIHRGVALVDTRRSIRTLETSHPPSYYCPPGDILLSALQPSARRSFCEWKGEAVYFDVVIAGERMQDVAWSYPDPSRDFARLRDHIAFYAWPFEGCFVDGERVSPQEGGFYGGWITSQVAGPFKGGPGSRFW